MKIKNISYVLLLILLVTVSCNSVKSVANSKVPTAKRVMVLGLDGISVAGYKTAKHPNLDELFGKGMISFNTRTVMPSVTLPNWTSHLTSGGPEQHGVDGNDWTLEKNNIPPVEQDENGYYPSIFKVLKEQMPVVKTAYYYNWASLINPINKRYLDEVRFLENDEYHQNYKSAVQFAETYKNDPSLIFLYSVHTDHAGHKHKWMSQEYIKAIEEADEAIGKLIEDMKAKGIFEDTHFILLTDHGGRGHGHGGVSETEMTVPWAIVGPQIKNAASFQSPNSNTNTAAVIARLFGIDDLPESWVGKIPSGIFKN
ncbi:alkaline phosphatase family protein [Salegentibacter maritimus]|uniref:alkaline phosphatase family protein n=1 Tax=Salegentibacter maritimus TaxID=2794347 RepID=UPI0018E49265|nr:alkaline phosphatase family protein [Salegentibacter maritimus]MBI6118020.1 alkaline phosphatase family protein [Salegentibacter maritimus]